MNISDESFGDLLATGISKMASDLRKMEAMGKVLKAELQAMADDGCRWSGLAGDYSVKNSPQGRMCRPEIGMKLCYSCRAQVALDAAKAILEKKD